MGRKISIAGFVAFSLFVVVIITTIEQGGNLNHAKRRKTQCGLDP